MQIKVALWNFFLFHDVKVSFKSFIKTQFSRGNLVYILRNNQNQANHETFHHRIFVFYVIIHHTFFYNLPHVKIMIQ